MKLGNFSVCGLLFLYLLALSSFFVLVCLWYGFKLVATWCS